MINLSRKKISLLLKTMVLLISLLFTSCLTLESKLVLKDDNSGFITFNYTLDKGLKNISNLSEEDNIAPLNLGEEYISQITLNNPGLSYSNYSITEDEKFQYISVRFDFDTINDLNQVIPEENSINIEKDGNSFILRQTIIEESEEIDSESLEIFRDIFKEHYVSFSVITPENIIYVDGGVKKGNKEAIYQSSITDLLAVTNSISWEISW